MRRGGSGEGERKKRKGRRKKDGGVKIGGGKWKLEASKGICRTSGHGKDFKFYGPVYTPEYA